MPEPTAPPAARRGAGNGARPALRPVAVALACLGLLLVAQVLAGAPAWAHSYLVSSSPADGTALSTAPVEVALTFDEPVSTRFSEVHVVGPDGHDVQAGDPRVSGSTVTQPLGASGPAGPYQVSWRVVSTDGHPVSGTVAFAVTTGGTGGGPAPAPSSAAGAPDGAGAPGTATATATAGGSSWLVPAGGLAGAAVLLVGGSALLARRRRGRGASGDG